MTPRSCSAFVELRTKAAELKQQGVAGVHERGGKRFAANRGSQVATDGSEEVLTKLLRFSLHQATAMDHLQQGAVVVFVVVREPMQQKLLEQVQLWDQLLPPQPVAGQWTPHPLGERRVYLFATMMEQIQALPFSKELQGRFEIIGSHGASRFEVELGCIWTPRSYSKARSCLGVGDDSELFVPGYFSTA